MAILSGCNSNQVRINGETYSTDLTELRLSDEGISNISALSRFTNLERLFLTGNPISDISSLEGLTSLTHLELGFTNVTNLSPLSGLTNLTELSLNFTEVSDISPLANLKNLETLRLSNANISDISALGGLTSLESLWLRDNQIRDIGPLRNLTNLKYLDLYNNPLDEMQVFMLYNSLPGCTIWVPLEFTPVSEFKRYEAIVPMEVEFPIDASNITDRVSMYLNRSEIYHGYSAIEDTDGLFAIRVGDEIMGSIAVAKVMGMNNIRFDEDNQRVIMDGAVFHVGSNIVKVEQAGRKVLHYSEVATMMVDNRVLLPLNFISQVLDRGYIYWHSNESGNILRITFHPAYNDFLDDFPYNVVGTLRRSTMHSNHASDIIFTHNGKYGMVRCIMIPRRLSSGNISARKDYGGYEIILQAEFDNIELLERYGSMYRLEKDNGFMLFDLATNEMSSRYDSIKQAESGLYIVRIGNKYGIHNITDIVFDKIEFDDYYWDLFLHKDGLIFRLVGDNVVQMDIVADY